MTQPGYFDSHCHLDVDVFGDDAGVDAVVARAREAGVSRMITIGSGYGAASLRRAALVAERHEGVWATAGVHPHDARCWDEDSEPALRALAAHEKVVALGEMGLDFHYDSSPRDQQREVFRRQLRLARELSLPVIIHDRDSDGETLRILVEERSFLGAGVLYHCYTGDVLAMRTITELGGYISIPGIVTFKNAQGMRDVARAVPDDRYMIETDSPFLTPVPFRGTRNEPARVPLVAAAVANVRGQSVEEVAFTSALNTTRFFGLPPA